MQTSRIIRSRRIEVKIEVIPGAVAIDAFCLDICPRLTHALLEGCFCMVEFLAVAIKQMALESNQIKVFFSAERALNRH